MHIMQKHLTWDIHQQVPPLEATFDWLLGVLLLSIIDAIFAILRRYNALRDNTVNVLCFDLNGTTSINKPTVS